MSYDIAHNTIKELGYDGNRFIVGIFFGFDNNNRIVVFGFSISLKLTIKEIKKIFSYFFDLIGIENPSCLITKYENIFIKAL